MPDAGKFLRRSANHKQRANTQN